MVLLILLLSRCMFSNHFSRTRNLLSYILGSDRLGSSERLCFQLVHVSCFCSIPILSLFSDSLFRLGFDCKHIYFLTRSFKRQIHLSPVPFLWKHVHLALSSFIRLKISTKQLHFPETNPLSSSILREEKQIHW